jgi:hypothetical protein
VLNVKMMNLTYKVQILKSRIIVLKGKVVVLNDKDIVLMTLIAGMDVKGERGSAMSRAKAASTSYTDAAQALINDTRAMRARIPKFVIPSEGDGRRLAPAGSVPPQFIEQTVVAVRNSASLVRGGGLDPDETRELMTYAVAFDPLADELEALAYFVRHSVIVARNKAGRDALTTYALAKVLAKRPETADLLPYVEDMRRALGRTRKGKSKPAAEPKPEAEETDPDSTTREK